MTTRKDYTTDEWLRIKEAAFSAGLTTSLVDLSLLGYGREVKSLAESLGEARTAFAPNELIQSILDSLAEDEKAIEAGQHVPETHDNEPYTEDTTEIVARELKKIRQATNIVDQKAPAQEAAEYRRFLYRLAEKVALASGEGFLGVSKHKISGKEADFLQSLKEALEL
jgi:hypothetical protein